MASSLMLSPIKVYSETSDSSQAVAVEKACPAKATAASVAMSTSQLRARPATSSPVSLFGTSRLTMPFVLSSDLLFISNSFRFLARDRVLFAH